MNFFKQFRHLKYNPIHLSYLYAMRSNFRNIFFRHEHKNKQSTGIMPNWIVYIVSIFSFLPSVVDSQSQWTTIGTNAMVTYHSGYILASATDANGNVYVVGDFYNSNNCQYVAKWTKSTNTWAELGASPITFSHLGGIQTTG